MRLYVDGTLTATSATVTPSIGAESSRIGHGFSAFPIHGNVWDARIYTRAWTPQEVAADFAGEWVDPTGLARWWTGENPGYGSTCREEIGGTDDAIVGALWKPDAPRKPRRIVEDVRAAPFLMGGSSVLQIPNSIAIRPEAQSCGWMCWVWRDKYVSTAHNQLLVTTGGMVAPFYVHGAGPFTAYFHDGSVGATVTGPFGRSEHGWMHFATVIDRSSGYASMYINASLVGRSSIGALGSVSPTSDMSLGDGAANTRTAFNDLIWRKGAPFTRDEIAAHYYNGIVPATPSGCIQIHWPLDEGSGTTVRSIPAGYEGTLSSASWTTRTRSRARSAA
ncbi:MAG: LamG domain-containing protein [Veillonellaceae bacterium]|nr:LamG domain-containing protein [Veillonellaceae bacterium]